MDQQEYTKIVENVLGNVGSTVDQLKMCLFSHDKRRLKEAEKGLKATIASDLPFVEALIKKRDKDEVDQKFIAVLPSLQKLGAAMSDLVAAVRTKVETETYFTDKALKEIGEIMALAKDLARDTNDALVTRNQRFKEYVKTAAEHMQQQVDDRGPEHQQRLITGVCTPKASFLYLDLMHSLKRVAKELSHLSENA